MKHFKIILIICACLLGARTGFSQPYQIRIVNKGAGVMGVEVRVTGGTAPGISDIVTDIVFGIKWSVAYNADLLDSVTDYHIRKSGTRSISPDGSFHYQAFYADFIPFYLPAPMAVNVWTEILSIRNNRGATGIFSIAETGFSLTTDPNIGMNLFDYTPVIFGGAVILPVTLTSFSAIPDNRQIKLQWVVQNEQNSKGFDIQRSQTETDDFKNIGWIGSKSTGNSNIEYVYTDKEVLVKVKYRYRLKQIDNDGRVSYSPIKAAALNAFDNNAIHISPNPVVNTLQVYVNTDLSQKVMLKIIDAKGAVIQSQKANMESGKKISLNTFGIPGGNYYLVIETGDGTRYTAGFQKM